MTAPQFFPPRRSLADYIEYVGYWERGASGQVHASRALPRGAATVIVDLGSSEGRGFYTADGDVPLAVPTAFIVGPGVTSYVTKIDASRTVMTIHFRPGRALPIVGHALTDLENSYTGLSDIWGVEAEFLRERMSETPSAAVRVAQLEDFLLRQMRSYGVGLDGGVAAIVEHAERNPSIRVEQLHALTGLTRKNFNAGFRSQVGVSPKTFLRVRRLQAAVRALNVAKPGATIAAELGFFDQAHFVREFRSFTAITPTQYAGRRSQMFGHIDLDAVSRV